MKKKLSSRARILRAIRHQEPDFVPVAPRVWAWLLDHYGSARWMWTLRAALEYDFDPIIYVDNPYGNVVDPSSKGYQHVSSIGTPTDPFLYQPNIKVHLEVERLTDATLIKRRIETPGGVLTDCVKRPKPGTGYGIDPNPQWLERLVKGPEDLDAVAYLLPQPAVDDFKDVVAFQDEIGERGLVNLYVPSAIDYQAGWAADTEELMVASLRRPDFVMQLLQVFHTNTMAQTVAALQAGVEVIFTPFYFASLSAGWSPKFYQDFILPLVREQVALVHSHGRLYHYYDDGKVDGILDWLGEAGVDILSTLPPPPTGDTDLATAKSRIGRQVCLNGNIDVVHVIKEGTPDMVSSKVREAIIAAAPGGGFILGTSDSIRDAPSENVGAFFNAARLYGNYAHLGEP